MRRSVALASLLAACTPRSESQSTSAVLVDLGDSNQSAIDAYNNLDATKKCDGAQAVVSTFGGFDGTKNATEAGANQLLNDGKAEQDAAAKETPATDSRTPQDVTPDLGQTTATPTATVSSADTTTPATDTTTDTTVSNAAATSTAADNTTDVAALPGTATASGTSLRLVDGDTDYSMSMTTINGVKTCIVTMPVNPISPALIQKIAQQTGATHIYSLGQRTGALVESGGTNAIGTGTSYYQRDGSASSINNTSGRVIESEDAGATANFTWDSQAVAQATGYNRANGPRETNNYICNATGYTIAASIGKEVEYLPGLKLKPLDENVKQGFLHVDSGASGQDVATAVKAMLKKDFPRNGG